MEFMNEHSGFNFAVVVEITGNIQALFNPIMIHTNLGELLPIKGFLRIGDFSSLLANSFA
jgi:hypothetical protein